MKSEEMKCPKCGTDMKEFVLTFQCRNLACRYQYFKEFPPYPTPSTQEQPAVSYGGKCLICGMPLFSHYHGCGGSETP